MTFLQFPIKIRNNFKTLKIPNNLFFFFGLCFSKTVPPDIIYVLLFCFCFNKCKNKLSAMVKTQKPINSLKKVKGGEIECFVFLMIEIYL